MIVYEKGYLFDNLKERNILIPLVVNTYGRWDVTNNLSTPIGRYFTKAKNSYLKWSREKVDPKGELFFELGETQIVKCSSQKFPDLYVANMLSQQGIFFSEISIDTLNFERCLSTVNRFCEEKELIIKSTKENFGFGKWSKIEPLLEKYFGNIKCYLYDNK